MKWMVITATNYRIDKGWFGGRSVNYVCPGCGEPLRSPLSDAGRQDYCPTCDAEFVVPGSKELELQAESERLAKEAKQEEARRKQRAKVEAAERRAQLERERETAAREAADEEAERRRLEQESRREEREEEEQAGAPQATKPTAALSLGSGGGVAIIVLLLIAYATLRGSGLREILAGCESYGVVKARVSYNSLFGTDVVVFDLRDGGSPTARRIDPVHLLLQFSSKLDLYSVDRVVLARDGSNRFYIDSGQLRRLADSYAGGGRVWSFNNLPASVRRMDGSRPYDEWTGGWLGVLQKQSEDLNRFITSWTDYSAGNASSSTSSDYELRSRVRETLRDMEDNVPDTLRSMEANLPDVMEDIEATMMADAAKYGLSPSDVRAQMREIESGARDQIRGMEDDVREQIRGMEDDVVENLRASGW